MLVSGSMSSQQSREGAIRKAMLEADVVDCMTAWPGQLFYSTQISVCLWFRARNKNPGKGLCDRRGQVLFIDACQKGVLVNRTRRECTDAEIKNDGRHLPRLAGREGVWQLRGHPRTANPPASTKSANTVTSSPPATASAPRLPRTTASRSSRRCNDIAPRARAAEGGSASHAAIEANLRALGFDATAIYKNRLKC